MSTPSINRIITSIRNTHEVNINYQSNGENNANGNRLIQPVAYGLTSRGYPVIRAFQPYGDTLTKIPSWKFFRVDRIINWDDTHNTFTEPPSEYNAEGEFNKDGDKTMSVVYTIANFTNKDVTPINSPNNQTKKGDDIFKTDTEKRMDDLRRQLANPKKISDELNNIKDVDSGPVTKSSTTPNDNDLNKTDKDEITPDSNNVENDNDVFKTDTEKDMERLRQQLLSPKKLSDDLLKNI